MASHRSKLLTALASTRPSSVRIRSTTPRPPTATSLPPGPPTCSGSPSAIPSPFAVRVVGPRPPCAESSRMAPTVCQSRASGAAPRARCAAPRARRGMILPRSATPSHSRSVGIPRSTTQLHFSATSPHAVIVRGPFRRTSRGMTPGFPSSRLAPLHGAGARCSVRPPTAASTRSSSIWRRCSTRTAPAPRRPRPLSGVARRGTSLPRRRPPTRPRSVPSTRSSEQSLTRPRLTGSTSPPSSIWRERGGINP
mmetsp:Transcript_26598/g.72981  ORF Transcript_26598/g.72981 Transcript_26598/m.72981 type:complete len:252 (+) Transcript_26598:433-1188(+)